MTEEEFVKKFPDERACRRYFMKLRFPDGFCCPSCQHLRYYFVESRGLFECRECRMQTSITSGTFMHGTKLPLLNWFKVIFLISSGIPCTARGLSMSLSINYRSAWNMLKRIRQAMENDNGNLHRIFESNGPIITRAYSGRRLSNRSNIRKQHEVVMRAKQIMLDKAQAYLKLVYRSVRRGSLEFERYFAEFFYLHGRPIYSERFLSLLKATTRKPYPYSLDSRS